MSTSATSPAMLLFKVKDVFRFISDHVIADFIEEINNHGDTEKKLNSLGGTNNLLDVSV